MVAVGAAEKLLLLSCLLCMATASPIQERKDRQIARASRIHRIKTAIRASQEQPSIWSNKRTYPNPNSPVANFDSRQQQTVSSVSKQEQTERQKDDKITPDVRTGLENVPSEHVKPDSQIPHQTTEPFRTQGSHSHLPAVSNFGDRIQINKPENKNSRCQVKGGCSSVNVRPSGAASTTGISSSSASVHDRTESKQNRDASYDQQQQFVVPIVPEAPQVLDNAQNVDVTSNNNQGFPDYEGLVSPQDFPRITETLNPFQQDDQQYTQNFPKPTDTQIPFQLDGQRHTQDFPRVTETQVPFQQDDQQYTQNFPKPTETQIPFQLDGQRQTQDFPRVIETQVPFQQDDQQYTQEIPRATDAQVPLLTNDQQHTQDIPRVIDSNVPFQSDDQQYAQDFPKTTDTQVTFQSDDKQFAQDFPRITDSASPFQANDQQYTNDENRGTVLDQSPVQENIDYQMQFVPQTGEVSVPVVQGNSHEEITGHSSLSSNFPKEQDIQKSDSDYHGQNVDSSSQLDQHSNSEIFTPKSNEHFEGQQHTSGQTPVSNVDDHQSSDDGQYHHVGNYIDWLKYSVPGNPGEDYPIFYQVPQTSFDCRQQQFSAGIYGDMEASCQVFHVCKENGGQDSFLCPNGTVFNQQYFVCDWWYNFRCSDTPSFYNLNADLYWDWENFTPSQVLNAPVSNVDGVRTNFQSGSQDRFDGVSGNENTGPSRQDTTFANGVVKSTIAIDNSAIADKNPIAHEQRPEEHTFVTEKPSFGGGKNGFTGKDQAHKQPVLDHFATSFLPDFSGVTRVQSATVSPVSDNNSANIPSSSFFTANNRKTTNTVTSVASDTGKNRQSGDYSGTRYPDQTTYRQHDFLSQDQNKPTTVSEVKPSDVSTTENKFFTQGPTSFEGNDYIGDNAQGAGQISHGGDVNQGTQFDITHQTTVGEDQSGGNHPPHEVQQEYQTDFFGGTTSPTFNPVLKDGVQSDHRNSFTDKEQRQGQSVFSNNKNEDASFQGVQQELDTTSFGSQHNTFATRDENRYQQKDDKDIHNERPAFDQQNVLINDVSQNIPDEVHTNSNQGTHSNSVLQQQHISTSFGGNSEQFFPNQQSGNFGSQKEFVVPQDIRTTPSLDNVKGNVENTASRRDQAHGSQNEPQQHVTTSFTGNNQDIPSTEVTDKKYFTHSPFNVNEGSRTTNSQSVGNFNQNTGQEYSPFSNNGDSRRNTEDFYNNQANRPTVQADFLTNNPEVDAGNSNSDVFKNVQQEFVPAFDDVKVNVPSSDEQIDFNQQHSTSFQPQNQNAFVGGNTFDDQNIRGNPEVRQEEYTSVPFSESNLDSFDSNRDRNEQQFFTNTNQGNILITDNQNYDNSQKRPNTFGSDIDDSKPYNQENPKLQQENVIFPFDGNAGHSFIPGDNKENNVFITTLPEQQINPVSSDEQFLNTFPNNVNPNDQQDRRPIDVEQKEIPDAFRGDSPGSVLPMENYHGQDDQQNRNNQDQELPRGVNTANNHEIRQEYTSSFDGTQMNAFNSPGNSGDRTVQDRYANSQQGFRQYFNQQNSFAPNFNENQQAFGAPQNVKQEHVPISFDNNHQNLGQNAFEQNENQRVVHQQNQDNFQLNSFDRGSPANQNANEAFQMRLNNFQPVNIHMMNRGGLRNGNYQQQRLNFRPYGQNDQNTVRFPVENGVAFRVDQQNPAENAYSGDSGPSNQNFFVTNGHQMRDEYSQQSPDQHFSNEKPRNNIQNDRQYGTEAPFTNNPVSTERLKEDTRNKDFNQGHPSKSGSEDVNFRIKGYSSNNARSLDFSGNNNAGQFPTISINTDDVVSYNQQAPESPSSMSYNGWKPVVKY